MNEVIDKNDLQLNEDVSNILFDICTIIREWHLTDDELFLILDEKAKDGFRYDSIGEHHFYLGKIPASENG